eukprot:4158768-Amphidinium_carterae.1
MAPPPVPEKRQEVVLQEREGWDQQLPPARDESPQPQIPKAKWSPTVPENASGTSPAGRCGASRPQWPTSSPRRWRWRWWPDVAESLRPM